MIPKKWLIGLRVIIWLFMLLILTLMLKGGYYSNKFTLGFILWTLVLTEMLLWFATKLQEKTKLSITDELTGLYNDRYFYQRLEQQLKDKEVSFGLVKVALDNLINFNEKYGYIKGDALIKKVAAYLNKNVKSHRGEKAFRYYGGQFLILLPGNDQQETQIYAGSLQRIIESVIPPQGIPESERIQVTLGTANYPNDGNNSKDIIIAVNESLEMAKEAKNRESEEYRRRSEKLAVVGQLAAGLAHEIRNPLTTVKGFCNLIREKSTENKTVEYINVLLPELDRVCDLVKEFLLLTKPAAPKLNAVLLQELVKGTITLMQSEAMLKDVTLINDVAQDLPPIQGDLEQLKQVLINLILNALEAMAGKGSICLRAYENVHNKIVIEIEDTGKGISNEKIVRVFEPFFTTKEEGTGLGLSIANQIIQSHKGKLTIRSIEGKGTTVAIELPLSA